MNPATSKATLIANSRSAWCYFSAEMPDNAMCGMPGRLRVCVEKCSEFIINETMNQSLFAFLLLHAIEGAINFGTHCILNMSLSRYLGPQMSMWTVNLCGPQSNYLLRGRFRSFSPGMVLPSLTFLYFYFYCEFGPTQKSGPNPMSFQFLTARVS